MKKKGSALLIVIIVMMIVFTLAAYMVDTSIKSNRATSDTLNRTREYYSAEAGVYDCINEINKKIDGKEVDENIGTDGSTSNKITYKDIIEVYKASFQCTEKPNFNGDNDSPKKYTFKITSSGNYASQGCGIVAQVSIYYNINSVSNVYKYSRYTIDSWKVYSALDIQ